MFPLICLENNRCFEIIETIEIKKMKDIFIDMANRGDIRRARGGHKYIYKS